MKSHFHMKGWAPRLALRKRLKVIRKWPINRTLRNIQQILALRIGRLIRQVMEYNNGSNTV